jgi:4-amino-4-deoxy-L-arabinose transferase-like glycosyltransferase
MSWRYLTAVLLILLGLTAVWSALHRDPWDPDETRYLQVTRELIRDGNPLLLKLNGLPYQDKPPLYFWVLAPAVAWLGHDSALAAVLPSMLAMIGLAVAVQRLGRAAGMDRSTSLLGTVLTVSCWLPSALIFLGRMDLMLAVWCTLALERLLRLAGTDAVRRSDHLLLWLWIGLGLLSKGPIAVALPLLAAAAVAVVDRKPLIRAISGWGPLLALTLVALWLVPAAALAGIQWLRTVVVGQTAGRIIDSFAHQEPWWYYLPTLLVVALPWVVVMAPAMIEALRRWRSLDRRRLLLAVYPVTTLLLLTLVSGKALHYTLPMLPPLCLVTAGWMTASTSRSGIAAALAGAYSVLTGIVVVMAIPHLPDLDLSWTLQVVLAGSLLFPGSIAVAAVWRRQCRVAIISVAVAGPLFLSLCMLILSPTFDRLLSLRPFGEAYSQVAEVSAGDPVVVAKLQPGYMLFTNARFELLTGADQLRQALSQGRIAAINVKEADRLAEETGVFWKVLAEVPYRHTTILLIKSPEKINNFTSSCINAPGSWNVLTAVKVEKRLTQTQHLRAKPPPPFGSPRGLFFCPRGPAENPFRREARKMVPYVRNDTKP